MNAMTIRDEIPADQDVIRSLHLRAFTEEMPATIVDDLRRSGEAVISLVAEQDGKVIGHVLFSRIQAPMLALTLSPLAVDPALQKKGIGSELVRKGLERAEQDGCEAVFLVGSPHYYGRFGFSAAAATGYASPYFGPPFQVLFLNGSALRTGTLVFPKAFAEDIKRYPALLASLRK